MKYIFWLLSAWTAAVIILSIPGKITFGNGLGDLQMLMIVVAFWFLATVFTFAIARDRQSKPLSVTFTVAVLLFIAFISLRLTLWRGPAYPWDGQIIFEAKLPPIFNR